MIKVYGYLGKRFTKQLNARVSSIGEAIRALDANLDKLLISQETTLL